METVNIARKVKSSRPRVDENGQELAFGMDAVYSEFNTAQETMRKCRRVMSANVALYRAQQRLRERLAEFNGQSVDSVGDVW